MYGHPNCKINIGLRVLEKRPDNFHNIETIFYPVNLCDTLEIKEIQGKTIFQQTGLKVDENPESNLCLKAYNLLAKDFKLLPVKIHLHKEIPVGSGLGGGSSDCAFTIKFLNHMFSLNLSFERMRKYSSRLGSDCAFFIENKPLLAKGRGDDLTPIDLDLKKYFILIVNPGISINTKLAYSLLDSYKTTNPKLQTSNFKPQASNISDWKNYLFNDFEIPIFSLHPELALIKQKLYDSGALYASMSGSGSAVYGIFYKSPDETGFKDYNFVWKGKL